MPVCGVAGFVSGAAGKACGVVQNAGRLLTASKKLVTGHVGSAVKTAFGASGPVANATRTVGFLSIGVWVLGGAKVALQDTATVLGETTSPQLRSTWFSATYWRMAAIAAVLTCRFCARPPYRRCCVRTSRCSCEPRSAISRSRCSQLASRPR